MLWGHPALLAASVLAAPTGSTLSIGDLPFHYVVDGDGDQVALPTTERLINLAAAEMLRRVGIDALMAHKGQPELRIAGLDTVNGSQIALPGPRQAGFAHVVHDLAERQDGGGGRTGQEEGQEGGRRGR